jgi:hypothetical protein
MIVPLVVSVLYGMSLVHQQPVPPAKYHGLNANCGVIVIRIRRSP